MPSRSWCMHVLPTTTTLKIHLARTPLSRVSCSMWRLSRPMIRVWSLRRLPGLNWTKAMRDIRSPPNTACGFRLETEASCSPDSSSIREVTTLVVPMSTASPNFISAVSPRSTPISVEPNVVTVTSPSLSRSAAGSCMSRSGCTSAGARAEDLERALVEGWREFDGDRFRHPALAREPVAVAHEVGAELELIHDRRRWNRAFDELHPAGGAPAPAAAGRGDVDAGRVRGPEDRGAGQDLERAVVREDPQRDRHESRLYHAESHDAVCPSQHREEMGTCLR